MFPESGGQPCDTGELLVRSEGGSCERIRVVAVLWKEGRQVHLTDAPLPAGAAVEATLDWRRRYDHMQQHTGQHVLSAVASRLLGADTASWELHPLEEATHGSGDLCCVAIDLTTPSVSAEQLAALESAANAEFRAMRPVAPLLLDPADPRDAQRLAGLTGQGCFRGRLPPAEKIKGRKMRLVHIEGLDVNACGGTHVRSTGELQLLKLVGAERTRGHTRLRFLVGDRALAALAGCLAREASLTTQLAVPPARHAEMVETLLRDRRDGAKTRKLLCAELAERVGRELAAAATAAVADGADGVSPARNGGASPPAAAPSSPLCAGRGWAVLHRPASDLDFLSAVAAAALEAGPELSLLLLTADGSEPSAAAQAPAGKPGVEDSTEVTFLVAGRIPEAVKAAGTAVAEALGGRGGGRPGRFQGKASGLYRLPAAVRAFMNAVSAAELAT